MHHFADKRNKITKLLRGTIEYLKQVEEEGENNYELRIIGRFYSFIVMLSLGVMILIADQIMLARMNLL